MTSLVASRPVIQPSLRDEAGMQCQMSKVQRAGDPLLQPLQMVSRTTDAVIAQINIVERVRNVLISQRRGAASRAGVGAGGSREPFVTPRSG